MIGQSHEPLPLVGSGSVEVRDGEFWLSGHRQKNRLPSCLVALLFLVLLFGGAVALSLAGFAIDGRAYGLLVAPLFFAFIKKNKPVVGEPWEISIPWDKVISAKAAVDGKTLEILVKNHDPKGMIYFQSQDLATLLKELQAHIGES